MLSIALSHYFVYLCINIIPQTSYYLLFMRRDLNNNVKPEKSLNHEISIFMYVYVYKKKMQLCNLFYTTTIFFNAIIIPCFFHRLFYLIFFVIVRYSLNASDFSFFVLLFILLHFCYKFYSYLPFLFIYYFVSLYISCSGNGENLSPPFLP